jgi:hypothetical protein
MEIASKADVVMLLEVLDVEDNAAFVASSPEAFATIHGLGPNAGNISWLGTCLLCLFVDGVTTLLCLADDKGLSALQWTSYRQCQLSRADK